MSMYFDFHKIKEESIKRLGSFPSSKIKKKSNESFVSFIENEKFDFSSLSFVQARYRVGNVRLSAMIDVDYNGEHYSRTVEKRHFSYTSNSFVEPCDKTAKRILNKNGLSIFKNYSPVNSVYLGANVNIGSGKAYKEVDRKLEAEKGHLLMAYGFGKYKATSYSVKTNINYIGSIDVPCWDIVLKSNNMILGSIIGDFNNEVYSYVLDFLLPSDHKKKKIRAILIVFLIVLFIAIIITMLLV